MKAIPAMTTTTGIKRKGMKVSEEIVDKTMSVALIAAAAHCAREPGARTMYTESVIASLQLDSISHPASLLHAR